MASGWTMGGVRQSGRHLAELPLAQAAVKIWETLAEQLDGETHYHQVGNLRCARNEAEVARIETIVAEQTALGLEMRLLRGKDIQAVAPLVGDRVLCASFCPTDGHADPHSTVNSFVEAALRLGVETRFGERVTGLQVTGGKATGVVTANGVIPAGQVVVAAGVHANDLIEPFGYKVPYQVVTATMMRSVPLDLVQMPVIGVANGDTTLRQEFGGQFRIGGGDEVWDGTLEHDPWPQVRPPAASVANLIERYTAIVPSLAGLRLDRLWCGLIDQCVDGLPVLDVLPEAGGVVLATGFSGHGFCLGPVTGQILADLAEGKPSQHPIDAFKMGRFTGQQVGGTVELHG